MMQSRRTIDDAMLDRLRNEAAGYSDFVNVILDDHDRQYGGADGRRVLIELLGSLIRLTGSENDAIAWLFNSRGYTKIVHDDVFLNLAEGDFWTLVTLRDWLRVIEAHQAICPEFIEVVFRDRDIAQANTL